MEELEESVAELELKPEITTAVSEEENCVQYERNVMSGISNVEAAEIRREFGELEAQVDALGTQKEEDDTSERGMSMLKLQKEVKENTTSLELIEQEGVRLGGAFLALEKLVEVSHTYNPLSGFGHP